MSQPKAKSDHPPGDQSGVTRLSEGQREVLRLVYAHHSSKEIAALLDISPHTVDQRVRQSLATLGVSRRQEAARILAQNEELAEKQPYQRLIHQSVSVETAPENADQDGAIHKQIRHVDRAKGAGVASFQTEQDAVVVRSPLPLPFATKLRPENDLSAASRLLWILLIACGALFSAGMFLAGLESLARLIA